jgi:glycerophosphoryl diester phosphodiesterase
MFVASVDASGLFVAKRSGSATITVKTYNGKPATIRVTMQKWSDQMGSLDIAHAMGAIDGDIYTNSLDAFEYNYSRGYRVFEVDLSWTSDGELVLWHNWSLNRINSSFPKGYVPTLAEFESARIYGKYTSLTYEDLLGLMEGYPDVTIVLDTKVKTADAATKLYTKMKDTAVAEDQLDTFDRMAAYVYSKSTFQAIDSVYHFKNYVYGYYLLTKSAPSSSSFASVAKFCNDNGIDVIAMNHNWWSTKYKSAAKTYDVAVAVHTVNSLSTAKRLLSAGVSSIVTDYLNPRLK